MTAITAIHKKRFEEMRKKLTILGSKESSFTAVELLFYEALTISRTYGNDVSDNTLLADLKQLENEEYKDTKAFFRKNTQREQVIRKFMHRLKEILNMREIKLK